MTALRTAALAAATLALVAADADAAKPGAVAGTVTLKKGGKAIADRSGIVVYLEDVPDDKPAKVTAKVRQKDKQFDPSLTVVTKGSTVEFPNEDKIFHNVFSVSKTRRFDLGLYKSGQSKSVKMNRVGVVDVYCNIHPGMVAKIKVVGTRYYAVTSKDGSFRIEGIPPGTYPIVAWQRYGKEYRGTVTVTAGGTAKVSPALTSGKAPKRHLRKDGTPYGRYK